MALALFDLDQTLLEGDSDYAWGQFLIRCGAVDKTFYEKTNQQFYDDYRDGTLDIHAFLRFAFEPLTRYSRDQLLAWRSAFIAQNIIPMIKPLALPLLQSHRDRGDTLVLITATNSFVTTPIAALLQIPHLIATEPQERNGIFTGLPEGIPCFREGKVKRLQTWAQNHNFDLHASTFYSDSHNDIPLLETVSHPIAVDPDQTLYEVARARGWKIMSLKLTEYPK